MVAHELWHWYGRHTYGRGGNADHTRPPGVWSYIGGAGKPKIQIKGSLEETLILDYRDEVCPNNPHWEKWALQWAPTIARVRHNRYTRPVVRASD